MRKLFIYLLCLVLTGGIIPVAAEEPADTSEGFSLYEEGSKTYTEIDSYGEEWEITITAIQPLSKNENANSRISAGVYTVSAEGKHATLRYYVSVNTNQYITRAFDNVVYPEPGYTVTSNYLTHTTSNVKQHASVSQNGKTYNYVLLCYIENGTLHKDIY